MKRNEEFNITVEETIWDRLSIGDCIDLDWQISDGEASLSACRISENEIKITGNLDGEKVSAILRKRKM